MDNPFLGVTLWARLLQEHFRIIYVGMLNEFYERPPIDDDWIHTLRLAKASVAQWHIRRWNQDDLSFAKDRGLDDQFWEYLDGSVAEAMFCVAAAKRQPLAIGVKIREASQCIRNCHVVLSEHVDRFPSTAFPSGVALRGHVFWSMPPLLHSLERELEANYTSAQSVFDAVLLRGDDLQLCMASRRLFHAFYALFSAYPCKWVGEIEGRHSIRPERHLGLTRAFRLALDRFYGEPTVTVFRQRLPIAEWRDTVAMLRGAISKRWSYLQATAPSPDREFEALAQMIFFPDPARFPEHAFNI